MGLVHDISRNRRFSNGYRYTADLGHDMKGSQVAKENCAHTLLSTNQFFRGFAASLDIVGIKRVEDLKILFVTSSDVGMDDGCI
jgi:hypothetical protein